ncbi:MAG: dihydropteroate synthase [Actinomycetota bacterium]|nr:dihydropteroate synthase [Actinomycetota bacterium]
MPSPPRPVGLPALDRCLVMGILNVTPDSFSDGGRFAGIADAVAHGLALAAAGADVVDVGGESTRPGAERVPADEEIRRVLPVITELSNAGLSTTIDTTRAVVAARALAAGAAGVNDVSGGLADPDMARVVADAGCPWVLMHWRGHSRDMASLAAYDDVVLDVRAELRCRVDAALGAGVRAEQLILDPGLGFAKTAEHNWALLDRLDVLIEMSLPVLIGASRKAFLGRLLADGTGIARPPDQRDGATAAITALVAQVGVWGVRVHEPAANLDAARVVAAAVRTRALSVESDD